MDDKTLHATPISVTFDGTLNGYQHAATSTAKYPGQGTFWGLIYTSLQGASEAGEFAGKVGKLLRDDGALPGTHHTEFAAEKREKMILEMGDELWYIAAKCNELGVTLEECASLNLKKLASRQERGTLGGSGDDR
jgi:NTP pyrophosphatase (non-canonical NTP hydrolase)